VTPPLPASLGGATLLAWRLDQARYAVTWDSGEGAFRNSGRWNNKGIRAVYCAIDPAVAILEVAVHAGFNTLDTTPHVLTSARILDPADIFIVDTATIPNANWLRPGVPSSGQKAFGDALLAAHKFILIPSAVSTQSWNLIFDPGIAAGAYSLFTQEPFALDTRLNPPTAP
jgi:RES domain-containing protein